MRQLMISKSCLLAFLFSVLSATSLAQSDNSIIERYGNLDVERVGPTIDAALAQKLHRLVNTFSNL